MRRFPIALAALILTSSLTGCGDGDSGMDAGNGDSGPVTEAGITTFYQQQAPAIRAGALDGLHTRLLTATSGGGQDGVTITPQGGNSYGISIDMDLDGAGALRAARETTLILSAAFAGDPTDGLGNEDFPVNVQLSGVSTPFGTYSASATVYALGGSAGGTTAVYMEGTSELRSGSRVESTEFGYEVDVTFPGLPVYGWEYTEVTSGSSSAEYDVCYRFNTMGGQYVLVSGMAGGSAFSLELGGTPGEGSAPCE